jgi:hypothetical protein
MPHPHFAPVVKLGSTNVYNSYQFRRSKSTSSTFISGVGEPRRVEVESIRHSMPYELAKLSDKNEKSTKRFLENFGMLMARPKLNDDIREESSGFDRLEILFSHAEQINNILRLVETLRSENPESVRGVVEQLVRPSGLDSAEPMFRSIWDVLAADEKSEVYIYSTNELRPEDAANSIIRHAINQNVNYQVRFELHKSPNGTDTDFTFGQSWGSMLNLVYYTLGHHIAYGDRKMIRCKSSDCHAFFFPENRKKLYCPPLPGTAGVRPQSPCGRRESQRRSLANKSSRK